MSTAIVHLSYFHRQKRATIAVFNETHAYRTTVYQIVVSLITYQIVTNLFSSSWFSKQLDIILLAHTLGTCDLFFADGSPTSGLAETLEREK